VIFEAHWADKQRNKKDKMGKSGDFSYVTAAYEAAEEYNRNERTDTQRAADAAKRAPVTTDYQRWKSNPSGLDFPGVDTPTESPEVLPKDLKQEEKPSLSARARGDKPFFPREVTAKDLERQELSQTDVSLSPQEAYRGIGAVGENVLGGFRSTDGKEGAPAYELETPPDIARGEDPFKSDTSPLERDAPMELAGGFELSDIDTGGKDTFTEAVYKRDSDIPGVEDVITVQERTDRGSEPKRDVYTGAEKNDGEMVSRSLFGSRRDNSAFEIAADATETFGPDPEPEPEPRPIPFADGGLNTQSKDGRNEVDMEERDRIMSSSFGRR